jgi:hypothetical protein
MPIYGPWFGIIHWCFLFICRFLFYNFISWEAVVHIAGTGYVVTKLTFFISREHSQYSIFVGVHREFILTSYLFLQMSVKCSLWVCRTASCCDSYFILICLESICAWRFFVFSHFQWEGLLHVLGLSAPLQALTLMYNLIPIVQIWVQLLCKIYVLAKYFNKYYMLLSGLNSMNQSFM